MTLHKPSLPIDAILPKIAASLASNANLVVKAPPGAGKTTRVPPALLGLVSGEVLALEPRRIAARQAARRTAWELGEEPGETAGYQVRFENVSGPATRLRFVTEGVLIRRFLSDPTLDGVDAVVLDEFHERRLESDLALALLKRLQASRPSLRIVVMSATLDIEPAAAYLGNCPVLRSHGRLFDLSIQHFPYSPKPLEVQVRDAVEHLLAAPDRGGILVFLPGAAEIRRAMRECASVARSAGLLMLPLHGSLSPSEQDRVMAPSAERKLILATNVAESSVTVEGVTAVIDSGLARIAVDSPWSGLPSLHIGRVSQASATQRAGRAGRTASGRVLRLYPERDYGQRPAYDSPEIVRSDLSQLCLTLRAMRIDPLKGLEWLDEPLPEAVQRAEDLLDRLGASGAMARKLARYPLHPRLSRFLVAAMDRGVSDDACLAAAVLETAANPASNDLLTAMEGEQDAVTRRHFKQLRAIARPKERARHDEDDLLKSLLTGFPDRVAKRRTGNQVLLAAGPAEVTGDPPRYEFMLALDAEDRKDKPLPFIRMMARIEPEWLIDIFPERMRERASVVWNSNAERADGVSALLFDELTIQESSNLAPDPVAASDLLSRKAMEAGIGRFVDDALLEESLARIEFAGLSPPDAEESLRDLCSGLRSFAALKKAAANLIGLLEQKAGGRRLNEIAPPFLRLANGRHIKIHYERSETPWVESRLQDFFGMREAPRVGPRGAPLAVRLLAPNRHPVQTTTDLAGFWERLYPQVRRELMRRYPKHAWPERP